MIAGFLTGTVTRTYHFSHDGARSSVQLRHNTYSGYRYLMIDAKEQRGTEGTSSLISLRGTGSDILKVNLDERTNITVRIALHQSFGFVYRCEVNGVIIKEANEVLPEEGLPTYDITIIGTGIINDTDGKPVVCYNVETVRSTDGRSSVRSRRFKEFFDLQEDIASAFVGNHMAHGLPKLPRRGIKLMSDHLSSLFIEARRQELQNFLRLLVRVPRVSTNPEFLAFIGMLDSDKLTSPVSGDSYLRVDAGLRDSSLKLSDFEEYSFTFAEGPLGIVLKSTSSKFGAAIVDSFNRNEDGSVGQAEKGNVINEGDVISRVNGVAVTNCTYNECISQISASKRPLTVHFMKKRSSYAPKVRGFSTFLKEGKESEEEGNFS